MNTHPLTRRAGFRLVIAGAAATLPLRESFAQAAPAQRPAPKDWYAMVQQHHGMLANAFKVLLAPNDESYEKRDLQLRTVDQLLAAHSFAEEMALYPALAQAGLADAERFYLVEGRLKVMRARLAQVAREQHTGTAWREPAQALQQALLEHAQEEEADEFAKLRDRLDPKENRWLGDEYARRFSSVIPTRRR
jgi:hypothetical protein